MATALFDQVIFGPIHSRRLGLSLGVNLLPTEGKFCSFECIYCECGWSGGTKRLLLIDPETVQAALRAKLTEMVAAGETPDVITFAGNGEPTLHPDFAAIIDDTLALRDELTPNTQVSVLSNATMIDRPKVRQALLRVDRAILKLDSAFDHTVQLIDAPKRPFKVAELVEKFKAFEGEITIQTMFLRGTHLGKVVDNTTEEEVSAWLKLLEEIAPREVMIYSLDRDTPSPNLERVPVEELQAIAARVEALGIPCMAAG